MTEPFNFTQYLREILRPTMKEKGFVLRHSKFLRSRDDHSEVVWIQRCSWNLPGFSPCEFFVNIGIKTDDMEDYVRLDRPTTFPFPPHYEPFCTNKIEKFDAEARTNRMNSFTPQQRSQINDYLRSRAWIYNSEIQLKSQLELLRETLNQGIENLLGKLVLAFSKGRPFYFENKMRIVDEFYQSLLPAESRIPKKI